MKVQLSNHRSISFCLACLAIILLSSGCIPTAKPLGQQHFVLRQELSSHQVLDAPAGCRTNDANNAVIEGRQLYYQGKYNEAISLFEQAISSHSDCLQALIGLGLSYYALGEYDASLEPFEQALELAPSDITINIDLELIALKASRNHLVKAKDLIAQGYFNDAQLELQKAIDLKNDLAPAYLELANLYISQHKLSDAVSILDEALVYNPDSPAIARLRIQTMIDAGMYAEAKFAIEGYDGVDRSSLQALLNMRQRQATLPPQYMYSLAKDKITRGDLASITMNNLDLTFFAPKDSDAKPVIIDISEHWARNDIIESIEYGFFTPYRDHTFKPGSLVLRGELASLLFRLIELSRLEIEGSYNQDTPKVNDLYKENIYYVPIMTVLQLGLMETGQGNFNFSGYVSGREAVAAMERLNALLNEGLQ